MSACDAEEGHDMGQYSKDNWLLILHAFSKTASSWAQPSTDYIARACLHSTKADPDNRLQKALELLKTVTERPSRDKTYCTNRLR
jgi:hypothetical protein